MIRLIQCLKLVGLGFGCTPARHFEGKGATYLLRDVEGALNRLDVLQPERKPETLSPREATTKTQLRKPKPFEP